MIVTCSVKNKNTKYDKRKILDVMAYAVAFDSAGWL